MSDVLRRRGSAIAVVTVVLLLVASIGATFLYSSRGGYRATAQAAYRLRLQLFLVSALDEVRSRLFQLTTPEARGLVVPGPVLREMILGQLQEPEEPIAPGSGVEATDLSGLDFQFQLGAFNGEDLLWASQAIAWADVPDGAEEAGEVRVLESVARVHGFRPIYYEDTGIFPDTADYYQQVGHFDDPDVRHRDYIGYVTVRIHAQLKTSQLTLERRIQVTHDIKITDMRPPARDFVLFSYHPTVNDKERIFDALNKGGKTPGGPLDPANPPSGRLVLYPGSVGRVYIRGPYVMLTEGQTDGLGGRKPVPGPSYPQGGYRDWGGFSQVPGPRGVVMPWRMSASEAVKGAFQGDVAQGILDSPQRPLKGCTSDYSDGSSQLAVPGLGEAANLLQTGDAVGFGQSGLYAAAPVGPGKQRFYLTGEPQCIGDQATETCHPDGYRGLLLHRQIPAPEGEEGEEAAPEDPPADGEEPVDDYGLEVWSPEVDPETGTWKLDGLKDGDKLLVESGPSSVGLYSPVKMYTFLADENCDKTEISFEKGFWSGVGSIFSRAGEEIADVTDAATEIVTLGGFNSVGYQRVWHDETGVEEGLRWDPSRQALEELAAAPLGYTPAESDNPDEENYDPVIFLQPFAFHFQESKTLGWKATLVNTLVDAALTASIFIPGPGIIANGVLRVGGRVGTQATKQLARSAFAATQKSMSRVIASDLAASLTVDQVVLGAAITKAHETVVGEQPDAVADLRTGELDAHAADELGTEAERARALAAAQAEADLAASQEHLEGEVTDADIEVATQVVDLIGTLDKVLQAYAEMGRRWEAGAPEIDAMMTGRAPGEEAGLDELRKYEGFGDNPYGTDVPYWGFLPPRLKPYQRLATRWHGSVEEALVPTEEGDQEKGLWLEGVLAFDKYPQEDAPLETNVTYRGKGMMVSTAGDALDGENQRPAFGGNIKPRDVNEDHLTLAFWTQLRPDKVRSKDGLGMISLGGDETWASLVGPYGARPLGAETLVRGNMVTGFLDRHRYPDSANLKLRYRYETLAPDQATSAPDGELVESIHSEEEIRKWQHISVSPKVAGWYDSVE